MWQFENNLITATNSGTKKFIMNGIKEIRQMLRLSQSELAEYLSIPRSTLSMAEMGQRLLTAASLLKIADLQLKLNPNRERRMELLSQAETKPKNQPPAASMAARQSRCNYKLFMLQGRLKTMSDQYDQLTLTLETLEAVLAEKPTGADDYVFWKWQQQRAMDKQERCGLLRQDHLRLQIKMLETEAEYYK